MTNVYCLVAIEATSTYMFPQLLADLFTIVVVDSAAVNWVIGPYVHQCKFRLYLSIMHLLILYVKFILDFSIFRKGVFVNIFTINYC
jgi:hypothetical protein